MKPQKTMWNVTVVCCILATSCAYGEASSPPAPSPAPSPAPAPAPSDACQIEVHFIREGNTFNDPSSLLTSSPEECCQICRDDPKCESWTRDRRTKACALKGDVVELRRNENFDSGVIGGAPAAQDVPIDDRCLVERSVDFTGEDMRNEDTANAQECCRMCEEDLLCFSWTRVRKTGKCFLKSGVPERKENSRTDGGTIF